MGLVVRRANFRRLMVAIGVGMFAVPIAWSQGQSSVVDAKIPEFEVASIRPSDPKNTMIRFMPLADRFSVTGEPVRNLIYFAYDIKYGYISGGPSWIDSDHFDIDAKIDDSLAETYKKMSGKERNAQLKLMVRRLLEERFKLKVRTETKELPIFALVVAKNGPKLKSSVPPADGAQAKPGWSTSAPNGMMKITAKDAGLEGLVANLMMQPSVGRLVVDDTGLKGPYDFEVEWARSPSPQDSSGPDVFVALQEQLGLKLEARKGPVETLVIEHVERTSGN